MTAAAAAFLSRPGQTPLSASELSSLSSGHSQQHKVAIPSVSRQAQESLARLVPSSSSGGHASSPSKPGILRRRGEAEREIILGEKNPLINTCVDPIYA